MSNTFNRVLAIALAVALMVTCAISGLILPVAAEEASTPVQTEPTFGVNLFTNKNITKTIPAGSAGDKGNYYAMDEFMMEGYRYVVRFEAKGPSTSVSPNPGKWSQNVNTKSTTDWQSYQTAFTAAAMNDTVARLWMSITMIDTENTECGDFEMRNVELLYAPADGRFNLVHNGDMEMAEVQNFLQIQIDEGGAKVVDDPNGSDNKVLHLTKGGPGTTYNSLPSVFDEIDYSGAFKVKMRIYGSLRFDNWAGQDKYMNNPGAVQSSGQYTSYYSTGGWTTIEYFIDLKNNWQYLSLNNCNASSTSCDLWIDDVEIYEISADKATDWTIAPTVKVDAVAGNLDINAYAMTTTPANASPYGDFTGSGYVTAANLDTGFNWTVEGGKTRYYVSSAAAYTGTEFDALTVSKGGLAALASVSAVAGSQFSLANVNPVFTVTDGTKTMTTKVEWEYEKFPLKNGNFEAGSHGWGGNNSSGGYANKVTEGVGYNGSTGFMVDFSSGNLYANQSFFLKPNSTYRVSVKVKSDYASSVSFGAYSGGPYEVTYGTRPSVSGANLKGKGWYTITGNITTQAAPAWGSNSLNIGSNGASASAPAYCDDFVIELVEVGMDIMPAGDFDSYSGSIVNATTYKDGTVYSYVAPGSVEGGIGGNTSGVIAIAPGLEGGNANTKWQPPCFELFEPFSTYKVSFKHYGDAGSFTVTTWSQTITASGGGTITMKATDEWKEYSIYYVPGGSMTSNGNWPYVMYFGSKNATENVYIDDFKIEKVNAMYTFRPVTSSANPDQVQAIGGTITFANGVGDTASSSDNGAVRAYTPGTQVRVRVDMKAGYLMVPGSLELVTLSGERTPLLNSALGAMWGSDGNAFTCEVPDETAYITAEFKLIEEQGYQWGTIATSVRREDGKINGMRFLNRLYLNGLDWTAEGFTTTIGATEYTVLEIGAKARVYDANATTSLYEDADALKGVCYVEGNPSVRVTDYTKFYFDFTVVIPIAEDADTSVEYECGSYMVLEDAQGNVVTVYTTPMVDSVDGTVSRGA